MTDADAAKLPAAPVIRPARPDDAEVMHRFIVELAEYEDFPEPVTAQPADLAAALFGPHPLAEAVLATMNGQAAGFALFYPTYSTVLGRPGIHLEDLYIRPEHRSHGLGRALLSHLAQLAVQPGVQPPRMAGAAHEPARPAVL
jgi:GNAT superfamily N-acetyltransferase